MTEQRLIDLARQKNDFNTLITILTAFSLATLTLVAIVIINFLKTAKLKMEKLTLLISRFTEDEAIEQIIMLENYKSLIDKTV